MKDRYILIPIAVAGLTLIVIMKVDLPEWTYIYVLSVFFGSILVTAFMAIVSGVLNIEDSQRKE
jgi:membrane-anchored glycerophosphoryl diester phosphodiesterase (GDPDase)